VEGTVVCSGGYGLPTAPETMAQAVQGTEVEFEITLPGEGFETEVFFSDLGHEYISINADYTT
jgi:glutamate N-acetyltransferase/amino-acid N-acetyltransferase